MSRGFYALGSSMMTQNRMLSAISNNIANVNTTGFKKDTIMTTTFGEMMMSRVDKNKTNIGEVSMIRTADESATIHSQGAFTSSDRTLDFALVGEGFFGIQGADGNTLYTRNGSFNLDSEGYLMIPGVGRVLGNNGPIRLSTDDITADEKGNIYGAKGNLLGKIAISDFADYNTLVKVGEGLYTGTAVQATNAALKWKTVEASNVEIGEEMTNSIATQRILQSVSQALKMVDNTLNSAVTQIARV